MKLELVNIKGEKTGKKVELSETVFGIEPNEHAIYLDVKLHRANLRQGTHSSKPRNQIVGSTKKIKKQKGTGTARFGDIKNPLFRGGGRIFGPEPRDYGFKVNKKVKTLARKSALSMRLSEKRITVMDQFELAAPKTKDFTGVLSNLGLANAKTLVVLSEMNPNVSLSSRNVPNALVKTASSVSTFDIVSANHILFVEDSIPVIETILNN